MHTTLYLAPRARRQTAYFFRTLFSLLHLSPTTRESPPFASSQTRFGRHHHLTPHNHRHSNTHDYWEITAESSCSSCPGQRRRKKIRRQSNKFCTTIDKSDTKHMDTDGRDIDESLADGGAQAT